MNLVTGKEATIRLQKRLPGKGAPHRAGVVVLNIDAPFEDAREKLQNAIHEDSMTRDSNIA